MSDVEPMIAWWVKRFGRMGTQMSRGDGSGASSEKVTVRNGSGRSALRRTGVSDAQQYSRPSWKPIWV